MGITLSPPEKEEGWKENGIRFIMGQHNISVVDNPKAELNMEIEA